MQLSSSTVYTPNGNYYYSAESSLGAVPFENPACVLNRTRVVFPSSLIFSLGPHFLIYKRCCCFFYIEMITLVYYYQYAIIVYKTQGIPNVSRCV